jgi:hypothetical protein
MTPSGARASVIEVFPDVGEASIEWMDGERARFRVTLLRRLPRGEP